ncbi:bifunctional phosphoribosylaminoimidazolecarboxamide formyltransferase/IMP cyclohydrolase [Alicyclobacillus herbarius]|uniref:bifunctional phosphoribosylaminoimidazolecarboxamide formyltransferase/IMP cyclohydrolase n=1 Tax=Alicyclobacillus herbarius TaxID=122960 RepID=UPI001FDEB3B0|nr:bifunctional phosphoribosylaminoimidazolecarboxamide formyltransferase/IMP cyclohydrolase [Alicyclobacillus herbarius]
MPKGRGFMRRSWVNKWALVSVFKKEGVADFCRRLVAAGYGILSTGGTARHLREAGIAVTEVSDYTGFPEMLEGRVKTLHPRIHAGVLARREDESHMATIAEHGIDRIDVVVVNLYPFRETIARPGVTFAEAIEMIDIGGPSLLRAAAKNHRGCLPVVDPADYAWLGDALASGRELTAAERTRLAAKVFAETSAYDAAIAAYLEAAATRAATEAGKAQAGGAQAETAAKADTPAQAEASVTWPPLYQVSFVHKQALRYGENPHQQAHFYADADASPATIAGARQLQGKELSYNNIQDADAALQILRALDDLERPAAVAVKHMNPCGVGLGATLDEAFARAFEADSVSIFGGIIALNRTVEAELAERLAGMFLEIILAPGFTAQALERLARKKNLRLLEVDMEQPLWRPGDHLLRRVSGGLLVQEVNVGDIGADEWQVVTRRQPTEAEWEALRFGWRIVRFVKSNAIVLANSEMTLGIGAGQMNRVGAAKIAIEQAGSRAKGSVLASDAFFPMRDTVDTAAAAGVTAIVQPGGSIKDKESIEAADEHGIAMVFTGRRHFLH